jgi:hypothetical protein
MERQKFQRRPFFLKTEEIRQNLIKVIQNLPLDELKPLHVVIDEFHPGRKPSQQALLFAGPMTDISKQAWFSGRQHSVETLHEHCKREFLPEEFDIELCLQGYQKWGVTMHGDRYLIGSTTQLTVKGYSLYLEQVFAFGAAHGVQFSERPA